MTQETAAPTLWCQVNPVAQQGEYRLADLHNWVNQRTQRGYGGSEDAEMPQHSGLRSEGTHRSGSELGDSSNASADQAGTVCNPCLLTLDEV